MHGSQAKLRPVRSIRRTRGASNGWNSMCSPKNQKEKIPGSGNKNNYRGSPIRTARNDPGEVIETG
jgi:hypothetical protein